MGLFSKKWKAPDPQLGMVVSLANQELPSLETSVLELVDVDHRGKPVPSGAPKALQLFATS
jgi:hypothetical protein